MIKAKQKLWDGKILHEPGSILSDIPEDEEKRLVSIGAAEYLGEIGVISPPANLIPEGNVESLKKYVLTVEDIDLLNGMIAEENDGNKRKTLITAIQNRIKELKKAEEEESDESDETDESLKINFNVDDVMPKE